MKYNIDVVCEFLCTKIPVCCDCNLSNLFCFVVRCFSIIYHNSLLYFPWGFRWANSMSRFLCETSRRPHDWLLFALSMLTSLALILKNWKEVWLVDPFCKAFWKLGMKSRLDLELFPKTPRVSCSALQSDQVSSCHFFLTKFVLSDSALERVSGCVSFVFV